VIGLWSGGPGFRAPVGRSFSQNLPGTHPASTHIIIIIIIITITISFIQGIYTYIPDTNPVPKQHIVTTILSLLFMVPISPAPALALIYFYISTFHSMCAVPNMAVFCSSLTSLFPGMVLTYFLNDFVMVPVAPRGPPSLNLHYYYYYY
jgi:ABC-type transport system involved in multi-copper enzyme maturation permease subunit